ncbi:MAG: HlyD family type I secretion periplasmic adaptor subunit [Gallionella sp.]|nr:HlyD family type I secretion periplasmic adaptor subunit [Gallionella sp.]
MKIKQWLHFFKTDKDDAEVSSIMANDKSSLTTDEQGAARWGLRILLIGVGAFMVWAIFAPLSEGVPAHGFIKVEGNRKTIQHLSGGIVEEIMVKEGDRVAADQPLMRLNETQLKAQQGIVESQLVIALAMEARLNAERDNLGNLVYPEFLLARQQHPQAVEAMQVQGQLFRTRRAALRGEEAIGRETIIGLQEQVLGLTAQEAAKAEQLSSFKEELKSLRPLHEDGYIPRNRLFELERAVAYLSGQRSDDLANIGRAKSQISEIRLKVMQSRQVYQKEVQTQLAETQSKVADLKERLVATQDELKRVVLRAPGAGIVVDLTVHTIGGVIAPGQKLMDIVPEGGGLLIEAQLPTHLIDNVHVGLDVDISFTAMDHTLVPTIPGKLTYVSADRMVDPRTDMPYFVGRVMVTEEGMKVLGKHSMQPGMPADVVVKVSERSMMGYMLKPLFNSLRFAFTER